MLWGATGREPRHPRGCGVNTSGVTLESAPALLFTLDPTPARKAKPPWALALPPLSNPQGEEEEDYSSSSQRFMLTTSSLVLYQELLPGNKDQPDILQGIYSAVVYLEVYVTTTQAKEMLHQLMAASPELGKGYVKQRLKLSSIQLWRLSHRDSLKDWNPRLSDFEQLLSAWGKKLVVEDE